MNNWINLNLDEGSLGSYKLGDASNKEREIIYNYDEGFAVEIMDNKVSTIFVYFNDGCNGFKIFRGDVIFKKEKLNFNSRTSPNYIQSIFGTPIEFWDDDVEVNYQFSVNNMILEFDWGYYKNDKNNPLSLDYMSIAR